MGKNNCIPKTNNDQQIFYGIELDHGILSMFFFLQETGPVAILKEQVNILNKTISRMEKKQKELLETVTVIATQVKKWGEK